MDKFFTQKRCDRCAGSLDGGRTMSVFNNDCICLTCKDIEMQRTDYIDAVAAERAAVKAGDMNFPGIGLKK